MIRGSLVALLLILAGGALYYLKINPPTHNSIYPTCNFHRMTGLHCPGCGMTRGLHSILNGDLKQALAYNATILIILPLVGFAMARSLIIWARAAPAGVSKHIPTWQPILLLALLLVFAIARNIPAEPFVWLAPHEVRR